MLNLVYIGIGGLIGAICRSFSSHIIITKLQGSVSLSTFLINVFGCFLLGDVILFFPLNSFEQLFFCSGFLSSFTTFSSFIAEIHDFHNKRQYLQNIMYIVLTIIVGYGALVGGMTLSSFL